MPPCTESGQAQASLFTVGTSQDFSIVRHVGSRGAESALMTECELALGTSCQGMRGGVLTPAFNSELVLTKDYLQYALSG